jgi:hypothetical protein
MIERTDVRIIENIPPLNKVTNRPEVIFFGADYQTEN